MNPDFHRVGHKPLTLFCFALALYIGILPIYREVWAESPEQVVNPKTTQNLWVSDMANVIDNNTESYINSIISQLEENTSAEIAVVTIQQTDGSTPKEFATDLFKLWGIGKKDKDNGVLILLVMGERRIEVETGYGAESVLPDGKVGDILDKYVIPKFRSNEYGDGLMAGVVEIAGVLSGEDWGDTSEATPVSTRQKKGSGLWGILKGIIVLGIIALIIFGIWRSKIRHCKQCKKKMRNLTEEQDDAYLTHDQKIEEGLGSVDYRVWRCDDCQINKIERRALPFKNYRKCPKCEHQTLYVKSHTVRNPTYTVAGLKEISLACHFPKCGFTDIQRRTIPVLKRRKKGSFSKGLLTGIALSSGRSRSYSSRSSGGFRSSSSSSSSSFGGGSSGGGGAGRSW